MNEVSFVSRGQSSPKAEGKIVFFSCLLVTSTARICRQLGRSVKSQGAYVSPVSRRGGGGMYATRTPYERERESEKTRREIVEYGGTVSAARLFWSRPVPCVIRLPPTPPLASDLAAVSLIAHRPPKRTPHHHHHHHHRQLKRPSRSKRDSRPKAPSVHPHRSFSFSRPRPRILDDVPLTFQSHSVGTFAFSSPIAFQPNLLRPIFVWTTSYFSSLTTSYLLTFFSHQYTF